MDHVVALNQILVPVSAAERNAVVATREKAMMTICDAIVKHKDCAEVLENAIAALLSLSVEDDNVDLAEDLEVVYLLLSSMKNHLGHAKLVKNTCMTLSSFLEADGKILAADLGEQISVNASESKFKSRVCNLHQRTCTYALLWSLFSLVSIISTLSSTFALISCCSIAIVLPFFQSNAL